MGRTMDVELAALRRKLADLDDLHRRGAVEGDAYAQARKTLEGEIVARVMAEPAARETARPWLLLSLIALSAAVFVAVFATYLWLRSPSVPATASATAGPAATTGAAASAGTDGAMPGAHSTASDQIALMIDKLAARLKDHPDDPDGWAMLARSYAVGGKHAEAVPAFRKAVAQKGDDPVLLADFADALAMTHNRSFAGEPQSLVDKALKLDPNNVKALSLAGSAAFERKDFSAAIRYWEKVVKTAPADSPFVAMAQGGIKQAQAMSGK